MARFILKSMVRYTRSYPYRTGICDLSPHRVGGLVLLEIFMVFVPLIINMIVATMPLGADVVTANSTIIKEGMEVN